MKSDDYSLGTTTNSAPFTPHTQTNNKCQYATSSPPSSDDETIYDKAMRKSIQERRTSFKRHLSGVGLRGGAPPRNTSPKGSYELQETIGGYRKSSGNSATGVKRHRCSNTSSAENGSAHVSFESPFSRMQSRAQITNSNNSLAGVHTIQDKIRRQITLQLYNMPIEGIGEGVKEHKISAPTIMSTQKSCVAAVQTPSGTAPVVQQAFRSFLNNPNLLPAVHGETIYDKVKRKYRETVKRQVTRNLQRGITEV